MEEKADIKGDFTDTTTQKEEMDSKHAYDIKKNGRSVRRRIC